MESSLKPNRQNILITGASRGIGMGLALQYASPNTHLILIARDAQRLNSVALQCESLGATTLVKKIDVCNALALKQFLHEIDALFPIDLLIANAGVASTLQPLWQEEIEQNCQQVFAVNVQGTINTINPLLGRMIARKKGQIALMSSVAGLRGLPQSPSYCASKACIHAYGQSLRAWLGRYHIKVNVIYPGYVQTDMSAKLNGPKLFLIKPERAAKIIKKGLLKNKAKILFPWPFSILMRLAITLPECIINRILNCFDVHQNH